MNILIVRNSAHAPEGAFGTWLAQQGHNPSVTTGEALEASAMRAAEIVLLLGSAHGA